MNYETEEQQVEALKKWWKDNGKSVIGGVLLGIGVLLGGQAWLKSHYSHIEVASAEYELMSQEVGKSNFTKAEELGASLLGQYADTAYAPFAALLMAKIKVEQQDLVAAKTHLNWAISNTDDVDLQHVARLRLMRVLLAEGNADEALSLQDSVQKGGFAAAYEEVKGDIYVAKGEIDQARSAYAMALQKLEPDSRARNFIEMKLDDLGKPADLSVAKES
ncbi:MAG: tetratricopeptide repeat protein [Gammaproteobacteria bacterium]|nr:tetratricopeptide repeat protein [Gammaproteobacteria bacterium]MDH5800928.1 tetratricopeptide repeat protein [Gammaproteobacteria bacterium]